MTGDSYLLLFKLQSTFFILIKVALLLKYFLFLRYRNSEWRPLHLIYFPNSEIIASSSANGAKVKKTENILTLAFVVLNLGVVIVRSMM